MLLNIKKMANITLGGNPISTIGTLPKTGEKAPEFNLTAVDLSHKNLVRLCWKKHCFKYLSQHRYGYLCNFC